MSRRSLDDLASGQPASRGKTAMPLPPMSPPRSSPSDSSRTRQSEFIDHARAGPSREPDTRSTTNHASSSSKRRALNDDFKSLGDAAADEQMDGMDEEGPMAFQCAKCRTILGDSLSWVTLRKDLKMVVIATVTESVVLDSECHTVLTQGPDSGATYMNLTCGSCDGALGKVYKTTAADMDEMRQGYSLDLRHITVYQLGMTSRGSLPPLTTTLGNAAAAGARSGMPPRSGSHPLQAQRPSEEPSGHGTRMLPHPPPTMMNHVPHGSYPDTPIHPHHAQMLPPHYGMPTPSMRGSMTPGPPGGGASMADIKKIQMLLITMGERLVAVESAIKTRPAASVQEGSSSGQDGQPSLPVAAAARGATSPLGTSTNRLVVSTSRSGGSGPVAAQSAVPPASQASTSATKRHSGSSSSGSKAVSGPSKSTPLRKQILTNSPGRGGSSGKGSQRVPPPPSLSSHPAGNGSNGTLATGSKPQQQRLSIADDEEDEIDGLGPSRISATGRKSIPIEEDEKEDDEREDSRDPMEMDGTEEMRTGGSKQNSGGSRKRKVVG